MRTSRRDDDEIAVDQRRLADQPRDLPAVEVAQDVALPDFGAVADPQARELAVLGEDVHSIVIDRRRPARTRSAIVGARRPERLRP